ncbi:MAG: hybrid sensor histidine kinase/response regulator [Spirochaetota bacterium]
MNPVTTEEKKTILVVDDVPENIDILNEILKKKYRIKVATNGEKALKIANGKSKPDLILLDIMMPGIDGYEVCQRLKAEPSTNKIPIIFITAKNDEVDENKGFALGAVDYITKPISPPIVLARIKAHISLKVARDTLEQQNHELLQAAELKEEIERITRHDLKSPLNAIIGYPELILMEGGLNPMQTEWLEVIEDSGKRMLQMINLSLDIFKIERGLYKPKFVKVSLRTILQKVEKELLSLLQHKNISLQYKMDQAPLAASSSFEIMGEELLCYSLFANLLKNAVEASPENSEISIQFTNSQEERSVSIRNAGEVPSAIRNNFFDKFVTYGKENGTGLGTYSAKLMAEVLRGKIELLSKEKGYTTILVHW